MSGSRTVDEKLGDWFKAYSAIRDELTPEPLRELTKLANANDALSIQTGMLSARVVFANDRAAATVAALLTQSGVKPVAIDYGDDLE